MVSKPPSPSAIPVIEGEDNHILIELTTDIFTLYWWKCYLDSCATYHTFFIEEFLADVHKGDTNPAWASGPSEILRYFFMLVVTGSGPRFR